MEKKTSLKGIVFLVITAVVWGFAFVAQTAGSAYVGTFLFNGIRFLLGASSLIPVIALFEKGAKDRKKMKTTVTAGLVCGAVMFAASTLQQYGVELYSKAGYPDGSGRAGFLTALYMVIVPLIGLFMKKRPGIFTWGGIVLATAGLFFISVSEGFSVSPEDLVVIFCAVLFAVHIVVIDTFGEDMYSLRFSMIQFVVCGLLSFAGWGITLAAGAVPETFGDIRAALIPILYGGIMSVGVAYTCQVLGQKNAEPAFASIILSMESMFSAIGGALILGERMTGRGYLGCGLIFAGILLTQVRSRKQTAVSETGTQIRVATFNIGDFSTANGSAGNSIQYGSGTPGTREEYLEVFRAAGADLWALQEDSEFFFYPENVLPYDALYKEIHPYHERVFTRTYNGKAFLSALPLRDVAAVPYPVKATSYAPEGAQYGHGWFLTGKITVGNKEVSIVSLHFDWNCRERRAFQIEEIIRFAKAQEYCIVMGDFNPENLVNGERQNNSDNESPDTVNMYRADWQKFSDAGLQHANGGAFGTFGTIMRKGAPTCPYPWDNIIVTPNIRIRNAQVIYRPWMDDHSIVTADLEIL